MVLESLFGVNLYKRVHCMCVCVCVCVCNVFKSIYTRSLLILTTLNLFIEGGIFTLGQASKLVNTF